MKNDCYNFLFIHKIYSHIRKLAVRGQKTQISDFACPLFFLQKIFSQIRFFAYKKKDL